MTDKTKAPGSEVFDQALKNYEQALRTGLKLQEEAAKHWVKLLNQAASPHDLQKQAASLVNDVIPVTQKSMQAGLELLERNSRASVELLKKGLEATQATSFAEGQNRLVEFCESSLESLKASAQAVVDINSKAVESLIAIARKAANAEARSAKA